MIVATNFSKLLKDIGTNRDTQIELLKEDARSRAVQLLEQFFADLFETNPKLTHVFCTGYTPKWNDGEECYHDTEVFIHNDLSDEGWNEMADFLECKLGWNTSNSSENTPSEELLAVNPNLSKSECRDIEVQIPIDAMSEALGTDWLIIATREGVELKEYDCGY